MQLASLPVRWRPEVVVEEPNTLFSRSRVEELKGHVQRIASRDGRLLTRLSDPRIQGIRSWEYGLLLGVLAGFPERVGWTALDVGPGNSSFPHYLVETRAVGSMTTLDLPKAYESRESGVRRRDDELDIRRIHGTVLDAPFDDASFDLVLSISAIEHLDGDRASRLRDPEHHPRKRHDEYLADTRQALDEMMRVVKPGGHLYLTTDAYDPERQRTDAWSSPRGEGPIWSAYHFEDIENVFVRAVRENGLEFVGTPDYRRALLDDPDRSSYRGRYFTTFCIFARRNA